MKWLHRLLGRSKPPYRGALASFKNPFPGWDEIERTGDFIAWRGAFGEVLSLAAAVDVRSWAEALDDREVQELARDVAAQSGAGLVEASLLSPSDPRIVAFIYKKLVGTAFMFTGMMVVVSKPFSWIWTVVDQERGTTGVREAVVTARLFEVGSFAPESYEATWARDPYDPLYDGVDRRNLRYQSDAPKYDVAFPTHPLAMIRTRLADLRDIRIGESPQPPEGSLRVPSSVTLWITDPQ